MAGSEAWYRFMNYGEKVVYWQFNYGPVTFSGTSLKSSRRLVQVLSDRGVLLDLIVSVNSLPKVKEDLGELSRIMFCSFRRLQEY